MVVQVKRSSTGSQPPLAVSSRCVRTFCYAARDCCARGDMLVIPPCQLKRMNQCSLLNIRAQPSRCASHIVSCQSSCCLKCEWMKDISHRLPTTSPNLHCISQAWACKPPQICRVPCRPVLSTAPVTTARGFATC